MILAHSGTVIGPRTQRAGVEQQQQQQQQQQIEMVVVLWSLIDGVDDGDSDGDIHTEYAHAHMCVCVRIYIYIYIYIYIHMRTFSCSSGYSCNVIHLHGSNSDPKARTLKTTLEAQISA